MFVYNNDNVFPAPLWVESIDVAVWVCDQFGDICYMNYKAKKLFGCIASDCIGLPCYNIICGVDSKGKPRCSPVCPASLQDKNKTLIDSIDIYTQHSDGNRYKTKVLVMPIQHPTRPLHWLVHCAMTDNKKSDAEKNLKKILTYPPYTNGNYPLLTNREKEVLQLLNENKDLKELAVELQLKPATIRNHVHRIQSKLKIHSIVEAITDSLLKLSN